MNWTTLLFSFNGRINRGKYWFALLLYMLAWFAFVALCFMWLGSFDADRLFRFAGGAMLIWLVAIVLFIAGTWSGIAVGIKRLHDRDKSGWWLLLFWLGPSVLSSGNLSPNDIGDIGSNAILGLAAFVLMVWGFIELGCLKGTAGPNSYGPDPLGPQTQPVIQS